MSSAHPRRDLEILARIPREKSEVWLTLAKDGEPNPYLTVQSRMRTPRGDWIPCSAGVSFELSDVPELIDALLRGVASGRSIEQWRREIGR
jgi:hypothetical protein